MIHGSIKDGLDILECGKCGKRSWVETGAAKVECPACGNVERFESAPARVEPPVAAKPAAKPARRSATK